MRSKETSRAAPRSGTGTGSGSGSSKPPAPAAAPEAPPGTRERILEAALGVLAERGLAGTTLREVARAADAATGLVNYHFAGKQELVLELIAISRARFLGELQQLAPSGDVAHVLRQLLEPCVALPGFMPGWFRLNAEIDALGLGEHAMRAAAATNKRQGADDVLRYLQPLAQPDHDPVALRALADVLYAALDGLAIRWLLDPSFDRLPAYAALERWVLSRLAPDAQPDAAPWNPDVLAGLEAGPLGAAAPPPPTRRKGPRRKARRQGSKTR